jgi:ADP-dependent glucokinase
MAQGLAQRSNDVEVFLVGPIGPKLKQILNSNIKIPNESLIENDEVHLILEYFADESYEEYETPNANRFIVSHDIFNSRMEMLDKFFDITESEQPDIIIFSGLHLLETQSHIFQNEKLKKFKSLLESHKSLMSKSLSHLELASIGDESLMQSIIDNVNNLNSFKLFKNSH